MRTFTLSNAACMVLDRVIATAPVSRRETDLLIMELNKSQSVNAEAGTGSGVPDMNGGTVETVPTIQD